LELACGFPPALDPLVDFLEVPRDMASTDRESSWKFAAFFHV
jgi:hypothetical protein